MSPIIGFSLDFETTPTYSKKPWYAIRENYMRSVAEHGAVPIALPHEPELVEHYLQVIDGLVITGGAFDIDPKLYGASEVHQTVTTKERRTQFEWAITKGAIAAKKPVLGICGGQQLLNVVLGGTLIQHIPDRIQSPLAHEQPNPRDEAGHEVAVKEGTLLHSILFPPPTGGRLGGGQACSTSEQSLHISSPPPPQPSPYGGGSIQVNSAHHQAVDQVAPNMLINAMAPDGVIEGIELPVDMHPFCLGVQWHPEYHVTPADTKIFEAFVRACGR
jgi:putative glutamine amidotransferase